LVTEEYFAGHDADRLHELQSVTKSFTSALVGIAIAGGFGLISAGVMFVLPEWIARMYTADREVIELAAALLLFAAVFQVSDGLQVAAAGALRGLKDTRVPMIYSLLSYWLIGLSLGAWLTFERDWGARGMWMGMVGGLTVAALLMGGRFLRSSRRRVLAYEAAAAGRG
ncbi:MAG: MATE family efflux transporter, partial [Wenzhouxiangellaceae bacterium]